MSKSKVDLSVFEELASEMGTELSDRFVYELSRDYDSWPESWNYKSLEQEGGESQGEYAYSVFEVKGKTYKTEYSYYSYDGFNYDDILSTLREVQEVTKTVTVWE